MNYRQAISTLLQSLIDSGMNQKEIAAVLDLTNANVVSMHLHPGSGISPFPLKRLPALAKACGLAPAEGLRLVMLRAVHHPDNATQFDKSTLSWLLRTTRSCLETRAPIRAQR
jgi:hypothetical protein